jgi:hypothetical protein
MIFTNLKHISKKQYNKQYQQNIKNENNFINIITNKYENLENDVNFLTLQANRNKDILSNYKRNPFSNNLYYREDLKPYKDNIKAKKKEEKNNINSFKTLLDIRNNNSSTYDFYFMKNYINRNEKYYFLFITFTINSKYMKMNKKETIGNEAEDNLKKQIEVINNAFKLFIKRLLRVRKDYIKALEITKAGNIHIHTLLSTDNINEVLYQLKKIHFETKELGRLNIKVLDTLESKINIKKVSLAEKIIDNNKCHILLRKEENIIKEYNKGSFIYIEYIRPKYYENEEKDKVYQYSEKKKIASYILKYVKKNEKSEEHLILNALGVKKVSYSKNKDFVIQIFNKSLKDYESINKEKELYIILSKLENYINKNNYKYLNRLNRIYGKDLIEMIKDLCNKKIIYKENDNIYIRIRKEIILLKRYNKDKDIILLDTEDNELLEAEKQYLKILENDNISKLEQYKSFFIITETILGNILTDTDIETMAHKEIAFYEEEKEREIKRMEQMAANDLIATEEENNFYNSLW